jgi:hypothetical protein
VQVGHHIQPPLVHRPGHQGSSRGSCRVGVGQAHSTQRQQTCLCLAPACWYKRSAECCCALNGLA